LRNNLLKKRLAAAPHILSAELDTPEADGLVADFNPSFGQQIFDEWSGTPAVAVSTRLRLNRK
jgi:hypothetical protein